jgi:lipopolysaccharide transport system permease protein
MNNKQGSTTVLEKEEENWTGVIKATRNPFSLHLGQVWAYRDLLYMFVKRDFVEVYKQTILGPLWYIIQPLLMTITFTVIFGNIAKISTDGIPHVLFYMSGITFWNYFSESLVKVSDTFRSNQAIFGKVYFPRLITPLSVVVSNLIKFTIQFLLFLGIYFYYLVFGEVSLNPNLYILLTPILIGAMAGLSLGLGMLITSLTSKYRDLIFLLTFGIQLLMYATPVIYPLSSLSIDYQFWLVLNPMTSIIETFKYGFLGKGIFSWAHLTYSFCFIIIVVLIGAVTFNKTEQNFMDSV